jgi:hypothetical protein
MKEGVDLAPPIGFHEGELPSSSRASQARAIAQ